MGSGVNLVGLILVPLSMFGDGGSMTARVALGSEAWMDRHGGMIG